MRRSTINQIGAAVLMGIISIGYIGFVDSGVWNRSAGSQIDISAMNAPAYQIDSVSRLSDGGYAVTGKAYGYQSDIEVQVTFDAAGKVVQHVMVLSQAETDGLGANITTPEFQAQYAGQEAPFVLKGKSTEILIPVSGALLGAGPVEAEAEAEPEADRRINPERWNPDDQSPEAVAVRNLYQAGLLESSIQKEPLTTAIADATPEEQAAYKLAAAGLTTGITKSAAGPDADSPEAVALQNLKTAGLTVVTDDPEPVATGANQPAYASELYEIDAVSGATISSAAMTQIVDNAYFFLQDQVVSEN